MGVIGDDYLKGPLTPWSVFRSLKYKFDFRRDHPEYFDPFGLRVFCGPQGSGKTLSATQAARHILEAYPSCLFCSNMSLSGNLYGHSIIPWEGPSSLSDLSNGYAGVLYLLDEIHLEFNSLESKNISIEEMIEFAQQRKQRKCIIATSQVFMRLAKPLREQAYRVYLCHCHFGLLQHNTEIDATTAHEEGGKLEAVVNHHYWWFHTPELYSGYDTYAKMQRLRDDWKTRPSSPSQRLPYESPTSEFVFGGFGGKSRSPRRR